MGHNDHEEELFPGDPGPRDRWFRNLDPFDDARLDSLVALPDESADDVTALSIEERLKAAKAGKAEQQNALRDRFFLFAVSLTVIVIVANFVLMGYYAISMKGLVPENVMMFWISATVVKILGIIYIIAQYLFPKPKERK